MYLPVLKFQCKKPSIELALLVIFATCSDQFKLELIVIPKYFTDVSFIILSFMRYAIALFVIQRNLHFIVEEQLLVLDQVKRFMSFCKIQSS